jgi:integrase
LGATIHGDVKLRSSKNGQRYLARVRWTHPRTHRREETTRLFPSENAAQAWIEEQRGIATTGINPGQTLERYISSIGTRWARGIDQSSTLDPYSAGLRRRVVPALGPLPMSMLTAGVIDRAIDRWEGEYGASTVKNTVAALVLVLDQAVRDGLIARNPAKDRARRRKVGHRGQPGSEPANPRDLALPDVATLHRLVDAVVGSGGHRCWGDVVVVLATTALRISEVAGLTVDDVDLTAGLVQVERQTYPGRGGLITKATKGRRRRAVPIIDPLRPTLERLTLGRAGDARLVVGPRGGVITTATLRDATGWDAVVTQLGLGRAGASRTAAHGVDLDGRRGDRPLRAPAGRRSSGPRGDGPLPAPGSRGAAGRRVAILGVVGTERGPDGQRRTALRRIGRRMRTAPDLWFEVRGPLVGLTGFEPATP